MTAPQTYAAYVTVNGDEWAYPIAVTYCEQACLEQFTEWLRGFMQGVAVLECSVKVTPVTVSPCPTSETKDTQ